MEHIIEIRNLSKHFGSGENLVAALNDVSLEVKAGEMQLTTGQLYCGAKLLQDPLGDRFAIENIVRHQMALAGARRSDPDKAEALREILTGLLAWREEWRHANCP